MKKVLALLLIILELGIAMSVGGCTEKASSISVIGGADGPTSIFVSEKTGAENMSGFRSITMDEAKEIFKVKGDYIILDVRRADEYAGGHIPGAINVANESISAGGPAPEAMPDKDKLTFVYCRSGVRSKDASKKLAALGYTNIVDIGGILSWTGEIEK